MNIKIVCPTRGLVHADTLESLRDNNIDLNDVLMGAGDLPHIQNELTRQALEYYPDYVFFIEDDMRIPTHTLEKMIKLNAAVVAVEYPMDNGYSTVSYYGEEALWCGLGCTLVNRKVLQKIGDPWFRTDYSYKINKSPFSLEKMDVPNKYGGHDIDFGIRVRELGYRIEVLPGIEAEHLRTDAINREQTNKGAYDIKPLEPIQFRQNYRE